jgi:hypothetical protein
MSLLYRCNGVYGNVTVIARDPGFTEVRDAFYIPHVWALYDHGRKLIPETGYFRGPEPTLHGASYVTSHDPSLPVDEAPDADYVFLGPLHQHYGHFLLATLSRLWPFIKENTRGVKFVTYGQHKNTIELTPFIDTIFKCFGIRHSDCVSFETVVRIRRIRIASPSFEETNFVHRVFQELGADIASRLVANCSTQMSAPLYLAKYKLASGVRRLVNEEQFASELERRGVKVAFPELLTVAEQIKLLQQHSTVCGLSGSALHTLCFVPPRNVVVLNYNHSMIANQLLIDRVCHHRGLYLFPPHGLAEATATTFDKEYRMDDPRGLADSFMRVLDPFMRTGRGRGAVAGTWQPEQSNGGTDLLQPNLALGRPARQSSTSAWSMKLSAGEDASGAVSGFCTGSYQFHTEFENEPWWDVDLGASQPIGCIRLYNRTDLAMERAARFRLLASDDGEVWIEFFRRDDAEPFGGLTGEPFTWSCDQGIQARFVRIQLLGRNNLHLDQVAIFGPAPTAA